jgi:signal transduction histidine kinase
VRPHQLYDWSRRHPLVVDGAIVGLLGLIIVPFSVNIGDSVVSVALAGGHIAPLLWRRRHPALVFAAVSLTCLAQLLWYDMWLPSDIGFLFALYALSAYGSNLWLRLAGLGVGALGTATGTLDWTLTGIEALYTAVFLAAFVALTWTLGDLMRTRRAYVAQLEERARRLEFERDQQARIARVTERSRIARELHDVVAHSLSVVVAQADGGLYAGERDPAAARASLATIGTTGRQAMAEMRRLLSVLRDNSDGDLAAEGAGGDHEPAVGELAPQPRLAEVPALVERVRTSGLPVDLVVEGAPGRLPPGAELAAYRIVQEALTNTLKHAGPGASASVRLRHTDDILRIDVLDDGRGASTPDDGGGQGLSGMRARVAVYGGSVSAGPRSGGGFHVRAVLPLGSTPTKHGGLET